MLWSWFSVLLHATIYMHILHLSVTQLDEEIDHVKPLKSSLGKKVIHVFAKHIFFDCSMANIMIQMKAVYKFYNFCEGNKKRYMDMF